MTAAPSNLRFETGYDRQANPVDHLSAVIFCAERRCGEYRRACNTERIERLFNTAEYTVKSSVTDTRMNTETQRQCLAGYRINGTVSLIKSILYPIAMPGRATFSDINENFVLR